MGKLLLKRPIDVSVKYGILLPAGGPHDHNVLSIGRVAQRYGEIAQPA